MYSFLNNLLFVSLYSVRDSINNTLVPEVNKVSNSSSATSLFFEQKICLTRFLQFAWSIITYTSIFFPNTIGYCVKQHCFDIGGLNIRALQNFQKLVPFFLVLLQNITESKQQLTSEDASWINIKLFKVVNKENFAVG